MSIMCKTGCNQQVTYENIEFADGFVYFLPRNLDTTIHYCPIFYDMSFAFADPGGPYFFDKYELRENSYGHEIRKVHDFLYHFEISIIRVKRDAIRREDILVFKNKLQSYLNNLPISGYYTDTGDDDLGSWDEERIDKLGLCEPPGPKLSTFSFSPLHALYQAYYVLGETSDSIKCKKLIEEISASGPDFHASLYNDGNPYEKKLIDVRKQLKILQDRLSEDPSNNKIKDAILFYEYSITGWDFDDDAGLHTGTPSTGLQKRVLEWHEEKRRFLEDLAKAKEKNLSYSELMNEEWEEVTKKHGVKVDDIEDPTIKDMAQNSRVWSSLDLLRVHIDPNLEQELQMEIEHLESIRELVEPKTNSGSFETNFNQNSLFHLSTTEQSLRRLIISELFDDDVYYMKKHFNQIWDEIELTKSKQRRKISSPKEETELDYSNMGHLIKILENKETKNRTKSKNIEQIDDLITKLGIVNDYRNQLAHNRDLVDGDLPFNTKMILVGLCNEIDTFCAHVLYR